LPNGGKWTFLTQNFLISFLSVVLVFEPGVPEEVDQGSAWIVNTDEINWNDVIDGILEDTYFIEIEPTVEISESKNNFPVILDSWYCYFIGLNFKDKKSKKV
jgi:hypothetical protein